jgi:hypothetical protein
MPKSVVRPSAGRDTSEDTQVLCRRRQFDLLRAASTTPNPGRDRDMALLDKLGLRLMEP